MIINGKYKTLSEASELLGRTEKDVFELLKHNFLDGRVVEGRTLIPNESIEKYINRFGKVVKPEKVTYRKVRSFTIEEAANILGTEDEVHKLIQSGTLKASFIDGSYQIEGNSFGKFLRGESNG